MCKKKEEIFGNFRERLGVCEVPAGGFNQETAWRLGQVVEGRNLKLPAPVSSLRPCPRNLC